ncbi:LLM class flavin-dependent oxidoreductase, partial [Mesorhizobium sp. M1E.F.Ca.ET.041.01.1.1]
LPTGFEVFADAVVPILRRRGLFRSEYQGTTLREHLGLARPESRYAAKAYKAPQQTAQTAH